MNITILDPTMCCSTGVCGEVPDDQLIDTAANVKWLKSSGHEVNRHGVSNDIAGFKNYPDAIEKLKKEGTQSLPYILINGQIKMSGKYPSKTEWENLLKEDVPVLQTTVTPSNSSCCSGPGCC